jgi:hypothetical protein
MEFHILPGINKLSVAKRPQVLSMLCEESSMQSTSRVCDVAFDSVVKLLEDAGRACEQFHDQTVRGVRSKVQCDEIWSFVYVKAKNVATAKAAPQEAGDIWTWTALDADHKLIVSYLVGGRDAAYANSFIEDVASRLANRVQPTTDGHKPYLVAVEGSFGADINYAMLIKHYGEPVGVRWAATAPASASALNNVRLRDGPTKPTSARPTSSGRTSRCGCRCAASPG